jgi:hypothetical protein
LLPSNEQRRIRLPRTARGTEIMAIVREMSTISATQQEIAQRARTSQGHVIQATRLLQGAPDLAAEVERGQISLTNAYRLLVARTLPKVAERGPSPQPSPDSTVPAGTSQDGPASSVIVRQPAHSFES